MLKADVTNVKNKNNRSHIVDTFQLGLRARYFAQCERYHGVKLFGAAKLPLKKGVCIRSQPFLLNKITFSKASQSKASSTSRLKDALMATSKRTEANDWPNDWHPVIYKQASQRITILEGKFSNGSNRPRDCDLRQSFTICKGTLRNECHRLRYIDVEQRYAIFKCRLSNFVDRLWQSDALQREAVVKGKLFNDHHRVRDGDASQTLTSFEGLA